MTNRSDRGKRIPLLSFAMALLLSSCGGGGGGGNAESPPPNAVTMPATNVTIYNAVLNGIVNPNGLTTNAWFEWGSDNAVLTARSPDIPAGSGVADNQVFFTATGLQPKTNYYFRIAAINSAGKEAQGEIRTFSTPPLPTVTTKDPTDVTTSSAKMNGEVNPDGLQTYVWFEWGTDINLVGYSTTDNLSIGNGASTLPWHATIPVSAGETYYYRIAASNAEGLSRGSIVSFRAYQLPAPITTAATSIGLNSADLNGTVNPNGFETYAWFEYGIDPSISNPSTSDNQLIGAGSAPLPFNMIIPGLTSYNTWYFRAVARNAGGTQKGAIKSFPTGVYFVAIGDSITYGDFDDIITDGKGFEPVLESLLSAARGYPTTIANNGVGGTESDDGAATISDTLSNYPSAKYYLILYGTNDADTLSVGGVRPSGKGLIPGDPGYNGSYKAHMQTIVSAVLAGGKEPYLAKVPYTSNTRYRNTSIVEYNDVIDELVAANGLLVTPPDFYKMFQDNTSLLSADGLHPDGTGYQSMANLWKAALAAP